MDVAGKMAQHMHDMFTSTDITGPGKR